MLRPNALEFDDNGTVKMELVSTSFHGSDNLTEWKLDNKIIRKNFSVIPCNVGETMSFKLKDDLLIFFTQQ